MKLEDLVQDKKKNQGYFKPEDYGHDFPRIPTGIFALDYSLGGGFPACVSSSIWGPPSAGKTMVASCALATAQKICWTCFEYLDECTCGKYDKRKPVIIQNERFDLDWASKFSVDVDDLYLFESDIGEETVDIIYNTLNAEDCGLVLLDSMSRVIPESEIVESASKNCMGDRAQLHTRLMNKVKSSLISQKRKGNNVAFITIAQQRAKIGGNNRGPTEEMQGCFAAKHDFHLTTRLSQIKTDYVDKETELPIIGKFKSNITSPGAKRKIFTMKGTAEFYIQLKNTGQQPVGTVLDFKTVFKYADRVKLIDRGRWSSIYDDMKFKSKTEMMKYWEENPDYYRSLKKKIVKYYCDAEKGLIEMPEKQEVEEE